MSKEKSPEEKDALYVVVSKLSAVSDFIGLLNTNDISLRKSTPEGLAMIIGECIDNLKRIGGLHEQPTI
jgi:hypothetical protein